MFCIASRWLCSISVGVGAIIIMCGGGDAGDAWRTMGVVAEHVNSTSIQIAYGIAAGVHPVRLAEEQDKILKMIRSSDVPDFVETPSVLHQVDRRSIGPSSTGKSIVDSSKGSSGFVMPKNDGAALRTDYSHWGA
jgi:hypothetical protein